MTNQRPDSSNMSVISDDGLGFKEAKAVSLYHQKDYRAARLIYEEMNENNLISDNKQTCSFNIASCLASSGDFEKAKSIYDSEIDSSSENDLIYNKALCCYKLSQYSEALVCIDSLVANCHDKYPELLIKSNQFIKGDFDEPGRSDLLQNLCIIEGLNLKSAILFKMYKSVLVSQSCLNDIPIKLESSLDCVTLHNQAIYEHTTNIGVSISKLDYLFRIMKCERECEQESTNLAGFVPKETCMNLILLNMMAGRNDKATELLRDNKDLIISSSSSDMARFLGILLERDKNPDELVYRKLDKFLDQLIEKLKPYDKTYRSRQDLFTLSELNERNALAEFTSSVALHQAFILWENNSFSVLERLLIHVKPIFDASNQWLTSMAHTLYMLDTRFDECVKLYEQLLPKSDSERLLDVDPVVLGNLCVSYVLSGRNNEAERLIKNIESEEGEVANELATFSSLADRYIQEGRSRILSRPYHSCITNLIIGTLYCVKYNYEFGLIKIFKTLEPLEEKLHTHTWFHVKRNILSLLDAHCKQIICAKDDLLAEIISFLIQCEKLGVFVEANSTEILAKSLEENNSVLYGRNTVTYEARYLRSILLSIVHD